MEIVGAGEGWHRRNMNLIKESPLFFRGYLGKYTAGPQIT